MVISICLHSFWGRRPQTPTMALPLDPWGTSVPSPRFGPHTKQISGYAPAKTGRIFTRGAFGAALRLPAFPPHLEVKNFCTNF